MPFTKTWDEAYPTKTQPAEDLDIYITDDKIATRERLESLMGIADFATRFPMSADALRMDGAANTYIKGGTATFSIRDTTGVTSFFSINTVTGAVTLSSSINGQTISAAANFTGTLNVVGDFSVNTNKFTVAGTTGNTVISGTGRVVGDFDVNTNKFTVAAASGNTLVAGTLDATGDFKVNTNKFVVAAASGDLTNASALLNGQTINATANFTGTLNVTGNFTVNTNKVIVTASTGAVYGYSIVNYALPTLNKITNPLVSHADWALSSCVKTSTNNLAPDGTLTATLLTGGATDANTSNFIGAFSVNASTKEIDIWLKQDSLNSHELCLWDGTASVFRAILGISWSASSPNGIPSASVTAGTITNIKVVKSVDNWWKISATFGGIIYTNVHSFMFYTNHRGSGIAGTVYVWRGSLYDATTATIINSDTTLGNGCVTEALTVGNTLYVHNAISCGSTYSSSSLVEGILNSISIRNTGSLGSAVNRVQIGNNTSASLGLINVYGGGHSTRPNQFELVTTGAYTLTLGTNNTPNLTILSGGASTFSSTLNVVGDFSVNTNKFTVNATSGNTLVAGTLDVTGSFAIATNKFTVNSTTGNTLVSGTLSVTSDIAVNTNKFTVAATTGNTLVAGTFDTTGDLKVNTNKLVVTAASGNIASAGSITSSSATAGLGYATGAGGTVTQITSRTTGVTLNNVCGSITLVSAAGSATWQTFTVTNSTVAATDVVRVVQKSGTDLYMIHVTAVAAGSFNITYATTGGTTTEQPVFSFAVIKAVVA